MKKRIMIASLLCTCLLVGCQWNPEESIAESVDGATTGAVNMMQDRIDEVQDKLYEESASYDNLDSAIYQ